MNTSSSRRPVGPDLGGAGEIAAQDDSPLTHRPGGSLHRTSLPADTDAVRADLPDGGGSPGHPADGS
ncbi:hypothetical protein [Catenulispora subtropica]|uniref:hypothetical protein n=1 Tax=Catenulispora subtropica TaxID=450798 RepID=UPI0031D9F7D3